MFIVNMVNKKEDKKPKSDHYISKKLLREKISIINLEISKLKSKLEVYEEIYDMVK